MTKPLKPGDTGYVLTDEEVAAIEQRAPAMPSPYASPIGTQDEPETTTRATPPPPPDED